MPILSIFLEPDIEDFAFMTTGQYGGIGALIHKQGDYIVISEPYRRLPVRENLVNSGRPYHHGQRQRCQR